MSGDIHQDKDQERFEDYLELEHFIEELQAGHTAHPPTELTPDKAQIYRMAALFRSASPDEVTPRPEFAAELQARLEQELQQPPKKSHFPFIFKSGGGFGAAILRIAVLLNHHRRRIQRTFHRVKDFIGNQRLGNVIESAGLDHVQRTAKLLNQAGARMLILSDEIAAERSAVAGRR